MKRLLIIVGVAILAVVVIGGGLLMLSVREWSNPEYLVKQIESTFNCRAEIQEADLQLFASPARMELRQVALAPRDEHVEKGTRIKDRPPIVPSVTIDTVFVEIEPWPLLSDRVVIKDFIIERPDIDLRVYEDGTTSLDSMMKLPRFGSRDGKDDEDSKDDSEDKDGDNKIGTFKASQLPVSAFAERVSIEEATVNATIDKTKYTILLDRLIVTLTDIDVDPKALDKHNAANLDFSGHVSVDSLVHNMRFSELILEGNGAIQPFEPATGEFMPSLSAAVTVKEKSYIDAMPLLDQIEDVLKEMEKYGISLEGVRLRGDFSEDTTASFTANRQRISITSDFMVPVDENFLVIQQDSWIDPGKNDHAFMVTFVGSERLTKKAEDEMDKFLKERFGELGAAAFKAPMIALLKQDKFLVLSFESKGDLGNPQVRPLMPYGDMDAVMKGSPSTDVDKLKKEAENLLKNILEQK